MMHGTISSVELLLRSTPPPPPINPLPVIEQYLNCNKNEYVTVPVSLIPINLQSSEKQKTFPLIHYNSFAVAYIFCVF